MGRDNMKLRLLPSSKGLDDPISIENLRHQGLEIGLEPSSRAR